MHDAGPHTLRRHVVLAVLLLPFLAAPAGARPGAAGAGVPDLVPVAAACSGEEHRQFDFWRGSWDVYADGDLVGRNEIRRVAGGCGLEESWSGTGDSRGTSLNYYDPTDGRWHQLWVGSGGLVLRLTGGLEDGSMVLSGERTAEGETLRDRITWTPAPDGGVRQLWEVSRDGGQSWSVAFDGRYRRR